MSALSRFSHPLPKMMNLEPAALVLADGSVFRGRSIGARGMAVGEVVFNTAMTGYQEILTHPSYCRQIVTLSYPHIGSTGINDEDHESARVYAEGLIVRDVPRLLSNWRAQEGLVDFLKRQKIVGIADLDTRKLTRILREKGAQSGCLVAGEIDIDLCLSKAKGFPGLAGEGLGNDVSGTKDHQMGQGGRALGHGDGEAQKNQ